MPPEEEKEGEVLPNGFSINGKEAIKWASIILVVFVIVYFLLRDPDPVVITDPGVRPVDTMKINPPQGPITQTIVIREPATHKEKQVDNSEDRKKQNGRNAEIESVSEDQQMPLTESSKAPEMKDCEKNKTGDYCFTNSTQARVRVYLYIENQNANTSNWGAKMSSWSTDATINPGQTECFNNVQATNYGYSIKIVSTAMSRTMEEIAQDRNGHINVEQCKSKTFEIK